MKRFGLWPPAAVHGQLFPVIEILEASAGLRYHDTCITDIRQVLAPGERARTTVVGTPWPAVVPCRPLELHVQGISREVVAEWRSKDEVITLPRERVDIGAVEPVFDTLSLTVPASGTTPEVLPWQLDCGTVGAGGSIQWTCAAGGCTPMATYPAPTLRPPAGTECPTSKVCTPLEASAFDQGVGRSTARATLETTARTLAGQLASAIRVACPGQRCSDAFEDLGRFASRLAEQEWTSITTVGSGPHGKSIATFRAKGEAEPIHLECAPASSGGAGGLECSIALTHRRVEVRYTVDGDRGTQYVDFGGPGAILDPNDGGSVSLTGSALRLHAAR